MTCLITISGPIGRAIKRICSGCHLEWPLGEAARLKGGGLKTLGLRCSQSTWQAPPALPFPRPPMIYTIRLRPVRHFSFPGLFCSLRLRHLWWAPTLHPGANVEPRGWHVSLLRSCVLQCENGERFVSTHEWPVLMSTGAAMTAVPKISLSEPSRMVSLTKQLRRCLSIWPPDYALPTSVSDLATGGSRRGCQWTLESLYQRPLLLLPSSAAPLCISYASERCLVNCGQQKRSATPDAMSPEHALGLNLNHQHSLCGPSLTVT